MRTTFVKKSTPNKEEDSDSIFEDSQEEDASKSNFDDDVDMSNIENALAGKKRPQNSSHSATFGLTE